MGKISCTCGKTIVDQKNLLQNKGAIIPDAGSDKIFDTLSDLIDSLVEAIRTNRKDAWMKANDLVPPYPQDLSASSMIQDLFYNHFLNNTKEIFQCENCGRILIQMGKSNRFAFFKPENENWQNILDRVD